MEKIEEIKEIVLRNTQTEEVKYFYSFKEFKENFKETYDLALKSYINFCKKDEKSFIKAIDFNFNAFALTYFRIVAIQYKAQKQKTKSVGNGEGSLYFSEKLDCWIYQYYNSSGKRKTMTQRKKESVKDFKARVTKIKNELNTGTHIEKSKETICTLAKHHIEQKHEDGITSDRSYVRDLETLAQIEKTCSTFCNIPIQDVTITHIENAKREIKNYSNSVINKIWILLNKVFSIACSPSRKILVYNIMQDETLKKPISIKKTKKIIPLSEAEYKKLVQVLDNEERTHKYRNIIKTQLISGMRIGEVLARSDDDFNRKDMTFYVHNTLTQDIKYKVIWSEYTKTYNKKTQIDEGRRYLPLDNPLFTELVEIINEEATKKVVSISNTHNLMFWDYIDDTFIKPTEINSWLERLNNKYHISNTKLTTHRLRHHALTYWNELGIPMSVIQYLAGHVEGSNITQDVYIDVSLGTARNVLNKIS